MTEESVKKNYLFDVVETLFRETVAVFNAYTDRQLKQIAKLKTLLAEKSEPEIEVSLTLKDMCVVSLHMTGQGLFEFLEFVCLHPALNQPKDKLQRFYESWLSRHDQQS